MKIKANNNEVEKIYFNCDIVDGSLISAIEDDATNMAANDLFMTSDIYETAKDGDHIMFGALNEDGIRTLYELILHSKLERTNYDFLMELSKEEFAETLFSEMEHHNTAESFYNWINDKCSFEEQE